MLTFCCGYAYKYHLTSALHQIDLLLDGMAGAVRTVNAAAVVLMIPVT
jgi:hypothetical protein